MTHLIEAINQQHGTFNEVTGLGMINDVDNPDNPDNEKKGSLWLGEGDFEIKIRGTSSAVALLRDLSLGFRTHIISKNGVVYSYFLSKSATRLA